MTAEAFKQQLEAIRAEYRNGLPAKLAGLDALWQALTSGAAKPARVADLLRELHSIAGSAKTFGVAGVSEAAAAAESYLAPFSKRGKIPNAAGQAKFKSLLDALKRAGS
jgi:chemotaxis protein histidine kinase CheA